ncbi:MAG TPA: SusC/RagA family TonB-linked outer membrane protein [Puia sp.]|nr:SusC/RagA family TonB-linked outer membrane protein [Puia sp.]
MRLTTLLLLIGCLQVSAAGFAQKVSLSEENAPLKKIFGEIRRQTGYAFFYNAQLLERSHNVTISVKDASLEQVLTQCFQDQPLTYSIVNKTIVIRVRDRKEEPALSSLTDTTPAPIWISGRIIDEATNKPVEGANITPKGLSRGVVSNHDGAFRFPLEHGSVLVITCIGYQPREIKTKGVTEFTIKLTPGTKDPLANMVVTGYQLINKDNFTGNAVVVSGEELKKVNPQNLLQSLQVFDPSFNIAQNNISGSNPNALPSINVRGSTALPTGGGAVLSRSDLSSNVNLPTFIMDGYEVSLEKVFDLDVNRIQSVTLLKDAAATAVYGSRAANGVMVITTKAPKDGKLQVFYNYELNTTGPDLNDYHVLDASQKLQYEKLAGLYNSNANTSQDQLDAAYYDKLQNVLSGVNTYWLSQPLRTTYGQKHSLYLEGGGASIRYGVNLLYQTSPGVMKGSSRDRYGLGMDLSYNPGKKLIFRNTLSVNQVNGVESPYGSFADYVQMNPYYPKTDSLGRVLQAVDNWKTNVGGLGSGNGNRATILNPLYNSTLHSFSKSAYLEMIDAFSAEWNIARGLRLRSVLSYTKKKSTGDVFDSPLSNDFYFYLPNQLTQRGSYTYSTNDENTFDGNATLTYNRQIGDHFINMALGSNLRTYTTDSKSFYAIGFTNDRFTNIGFAGGYPAGTTPGGDYSQQRLFGSFATLNYAWKNKYLLDATIREDGSSLFGTQNKEASFWALGLGWNAFKEDFLALSPVISQLRFRASTGLTGSVSFAPYQAETTYTYYANSWYSTGVGASVNTYGNEALKWQRTRSYDVGMDLGLFKDRLIISPRYYYKLTHGLLADINLPPSTGFESYTDNLGDMANRGAELNFKYAAIRNKNWNVSFFANLVNNTNKIVRISDALKNYNNKANQVQKDSLPSTPLLRFQEGQSLNMIYAVRSLGIDPQNGRELYIKKDGTHTYTWDANDIVPVADNTPKVMGSFGTTMSYKRFQLNAIFTTRLGGKDYNQTLSDRVENADPRYNVDSRALTERWQKPGDHALFKNISDLSTTFVSSRFIQKDNTVDLTSVYLSYDFDKAFYSRLAMQNLRVAFTMNDIAHWSSLKIERGIDYPYAKSFTLSIQTSF